MKKSSPPPHPLFDDLFTIEETYTQLRIGRTTLWKETKNGAIAFVPIGRRRFYTRSAIQDYIAHREQKAGRRT